MKRSIFQWLSFVLLSFIAWEMPVQAGQAASIAEIGEHQPILTIQKNVHPQNLMIVYTKVDAEGRFSRDPENPALPILDFYWLMDGKTYKPVNALIKKEIRKRLELQTGSVGSARHFVIDLNDLKEVNSDIKEPKVDVYVNDAVAPREVEAQMTLGPSDKEMRIKVSSIYTEGRAFPPAVYSVTLKGEEVANGQPTGRKITRKYEGKEKPE